MNNEELNFHLKLVQKLKAINQSHSKQARAKTLIKAREVIKGLLIDDKYDVEIDLIDQIDQLLKNENMKQSKNELGKRKQEENIIQLIEHHTKKLAREKDLALDLLKNISLILIRMSDSQNYMIYLYDTLNGNHEVLKFTQTSFDIATSSTIEYTGQIQE